MEQERCPECGHDADTCLLCIDSGCGNCDCDCECDYVPDPRILKRLLFEHAPEWRERN